jgi:hypothetical protein
MDAASGASVPEAAVLDYIVGSFDSCPVVVRLVQDGLFRLYVLAVFLDSIFDPVSDSSARSFTPSSRSSGAS